MTTIKSTNKPSESNGSKDSPSRALHAYQQLLAAIKGGELLPGSRIREIELAKQLNISRTPVREALHRLEIEGLVSIAPRRGMVVTKLDYQSVMELYQMREVLEATASSLAAKHASESEIQALKQMLLQQKMKLENAQWQSQQNQMFHNALYHAAHNRYLLKTLKSIRDAMVLLGVTTYTLPGRATEAVDEHEEILKAIENGDEKAAAAASHRHIRAAQKARVLLINQQQL